MSASDGSRSDMFQMQAKIRHDAEDTSQFLASLRSWESDARVRDKKLSEKGRARKAAGLTPAYGAESLEDGSRGGRVTTTHTPSSVAALGTAADTAGGGTPSAAGGSGGGHRAPDVVEREDGNAHFKRGEFAPAIKCYTRAIAHNPSSVLAYSNRAMSYLRMREFTKAVDDATHALHLDSNHVKSLLRRGTAFNALGRHRNAMEDFELAHGLQPGNKQVAAELRKTKELRRVAIRRAPRTRLPVVVCRGASGGGGERSAVSDMSALD